MYCNSVFVTEPFARYVAFIPVSNARVTAPDVPPPVNPVPAVTLVISPLLKLETKTFFVVLASVS